jgi:alpha-beta hydrolase superfamily lysophospholipase
VREGHTFLYWQGSSYSPGDQYTVAGNHVFTAIWEKNSNPPDVPDTPGTGDSSQSMFWLIMMLLMTGMSVIAADMRIRFR